MANSIGQTIKRLRKERNLTQDELAEQLNVTAQAVSKWENETGLPDISQIIPLASVFGVSTDILFGIEGASENDEALRIVQKADAIKEYGKQNTYLRAYDMMIDGLKKYPNNMTLLNNCIRLGLALALPENGYLYSAERAKEICVETIRQANLIISYSKNISEIMTARQTLIFLYLSEGRYDKASVEALNFPARTDLTLYSNMARVNEYMGNHAREITYLCSDIDYALQTLEDNTVRLGKAYYKIGRYNNAIDVYQTFLNILKVVFKEGHHPPYHDFDSGDCYILLAQAYLAIGDADQAMNAVENSIMYYLNLIEHCTGDVIERNALIKSPLVRESELTACTTKSAIKNRLIEKLSAEEIQPLSKDKRFQDLHENICNLKI